MTLTAPQSTPAIDAAIHRPNRTLYQLQPSFHAQSTEPEPTARARRAGKEFYQTTPEFMFVSFPLVVVESIKAASTAASTIKCPVRAARFVDFASPHFSKDGRKPRHASISDAATQMDHNAVVLFTIDQLARSPRTTVRTRSPGKALDP